MFPEFDSRQYFLDLLAISLVLAPLFAAVRLPWLRRALLGLGGAYLLYGIAPRLALFYLAGWSAVFVLHRAIAAGASSRFATGLLWSGLLLALAPMLAWKLAGEPFTTAFNLLSNHAVRVFGVGVWETDLARDVLVPIGLSFATFRAVDLLVKTYLGRVAALSFDRVLFFGFFPPVLMVGPIIEYEEVQERCESSELPSAQDVFVGLSRIGFGLVKVFLLAAMLRGSTSGFESFEGLAPYQTWIGLFVFTWFFYLNFSGYSDLAIGSARLYGFQLRENFEFPFFRQNIADFWNSWHASLSRFAQRNVFVPLGGYRARHQTRAIVGTMMVIALWHGLSLGMLLFGLYHSLGLLVHRMAAQRAVRAEGDESLAAGFSKMAATYVFVALSFPLLVVPPERAAAFYLALVGL